LFIIHASNFTSKILASRQQHNAASKIHLLCETTAWMQKRWQGLFTTFANNAGLHGQGWRTDGTLHSTEISHAHQLNDLILASN